MEAPQWSPIQWAAIAHLCGPWESVHVTMTRTGSPWSMTVCAYAPKILNLNLKYRDTGVEQMLPLPRKKQRINSLALTFLGEERLFFL